jgi:hypothetical protein
MNITSNNEHNTSIMNLKLISRDLWCNFAWALRNYVVSGIADLQDAASGKDMVISSIGDISENIAISHGKSAGMKIMQALYGMFSRFIDKIESFKKGEISIEIDKVDDAIISSTSDFLTTLCPKTWNYKECTECVETLFSLVLNGIIARIAQEWDLSIRYHKQIIHQVKHISDRIVECSTVILTKGGNHVL